MIEFLIPSNSNDDFNNVLYLYTIICSDVYSGRRMAHDLLPKGISTFSG